MKKHIYLKLFLFFVCLQTVTFNLFAQVPNPISFNTAVNASLNGTIPLDSLDLSWTTSSVSINGPYVPAVRASNQMAWLVSPYTTANWITYPYHCTLNPVEHSCLGGVDDYFRLMFTLPSIACSDSVHKTGGYCLTMNYFADNCVYEIFVNGISSYIYTGTVSASFYSGFNAAGNTSVTLCSNWQAGTNTLVVHVKSSPPTVGFLAFITATATTPGGFTATATPSNVSCFGANNGKAAVQLNGYSGSSTYTWLPSGGTSSITSNLSPGIYTVNIQMPMCDLTRTISITQPSSFAVNVSTAQPKCIGEKVVFTASGGETYSWSPGNLSGASVTLTPSGTTVYTVTATNSNGCKSIQTFTPQALKCAGIEKQVLQDIQVRRTNSGNILLVKDNENECKLEIYDLNGQLKYSNIMFQTYEIDVNNLPGGIYILKISDNNSSYRKRLLVDK